MFFIGIFGINETQKTIGTYNNVVCPSCQALTHLELLKAYSYFHLFFIPTFKWNLRYYVKSACCNCIYELDPIIARQYEEGQLPKITSGHIHPLVHPTDYPLPYKTCHYCGNRAEIKYNFCAHCGQKL